MSEPSKTPVVNSYTEWDPLEEVIVGVVEGGAVNDWEPGFEAMIPEGRLELIKSYHLENAGQPHTDAQLIPAQRELEEFVRILRAEGITVRRPDVLDNTRPYSTPYFDCKSGWGQYNPRDVMIVIGQEIIESSMSWQCRYFEFQSYRRLVKDYFSRGARWTQAPKATMSEELYKPDHKRGPNWEWVTTEFEPAWDAADIARCGRDLFFQRSHTSNRFAAEWLQRHLGDEYRVHVVEFEDDRAVHIDATFLPLAPGKILVNPDRPMKNMPDWLKKSGWEFLECPRTTFPRDLPSFRGFEWLSINMLSLDEKRIIVEAQEEPLIRALRDWGFEPIPVAYRNCYKHGGSFHCSTVDIRRRGTLQSYF
ncbi:MAG: amidinotransferase [Myxococcales bacterium]|nr:amidinotransferase [Myxococcales bacterium]